MHFDNIQTKIWAGVPPLGTGQQPEYIETTYYHLHGNMHSDIAIH